jgi:hypothetical protein
VGGTPSNATPKLHRIKLKQLQNHHPHNIIDSLSWLTVKMSQKTTQETACLANTLSRLLNNPSHHTTNDYVNFPNNPV